MYSYVKLFYQLMMIYHSSNLFAKKVEMHIKKAPDRFSKGVEDMNDHNNII